MTWTIWMAGFIVLLTIAALLKRIETRLVLFVAGLVMALFALSPQTALGAFVANMTNKSLITAICSSMGFAAVIAITRCDVHFVGLMVKPLGLDCEETVLEKRWGEPVYESKVLTTAWRHGDKTVQFIVNWTHEPQTVRLEKSSGMTLRHGGKVMDTDGKITLGALESVAVEF